jgi:hypothetical protein
MCRYRAAASRLAFKGIEQVVRQRLEKRFRNLELVLGEADRPFGFSRLRDGANFSYWRISFAEENSFSFRKLVQVFREVGLGFVYI